jgi:fructokinase
VFISLSEAGERSFAHYRTRSAEFFLSAADVDGELLARARAVHCGTNSLLFPEAREAMVQLFRQAAASGKIACCDPNLRLCVWKDPAALRGTLDRLFPCCSVVKLAEDEIEFATGETTPEGALEALERLGVALPVVTLGPRGAWLSFAGRRLRVEAPAVKVVARLQAGEVEALARFACRAASRVCERLGAVDGLPRAAELPELWPGRDSR